MELVRGICLLLLGLPAWIGWTWLKPNRRCRGRCRGEGRIHRRGALRWMFGPGEGHALCPECGGNGREPKPMHTFLYERVGLFRYPADETGPGWSRNRRRRARLKSAGRKVIR